MNWEAIGAVGEVAGAVGVIVTLIVCPSTALAISRTAPMASQFMVTPR